MKIVKKLMWGVLILVLILAVGGGYAFWRFGQDPDYWTQNQRYLQAHSREELESIADNLFNRVVTQATSVHAQGHRRTGGGGGGGGQRAVNLANRASGGGIVQAGTTADATIVIDQAPREIVITPDEANAWLATRLESVAASQGFTFPTGVSDAMISLKNGKLISAFRVQRQGIDRPVSMIFDARINPGGQATLKLNEVKGGELDLPLKQLVSHLGGEDEARAAVDQQKKLLAKLEEAYAGKTFDPVFKIDDKRNLRIMAIDLTGPNIKMTVKTEPRG